MNTSLAVYAVGEVFLCKKGWCIALIISVIHIGLLLTGVRMPVQENPHFRDFLL